MSDADVTRRASPARVPLLARRVADRYPTARRNAELAAAVAGRREPKRRVAIDRLARARRPERPEVVAPPAAPEARPEGVSDFGFRWMFGDGQVDGVPFAGGAAISQVQSELDEDHESGRGAHAAQARPAGPALPRGRVLEVTHSRPIQTPPPAGDDTPHVPAAGAAPPAPQIEHFGPPARAGLGLAEALDLTPGRGRDADDGAAPADGPAVPVARAPVTLTPASTAPVAAPRSRLRVQRGVLPPAPESPSRGPVAEPPSSDRSGNAARRRPNPTAGDAKPAAAKTAQTEPASKPKPRKSAGKGGTAKSTARKQNPSKGAATRDASGKAHGARPSTSPDET